MASTDPIDFPLLQPALGGDTYLPDTAVGEHDYRAMRLYSRLAAAIPALIAILLALLVAWIYVVLYDGQWRSRETLAPLSLIVLAAAFYARAELRLRSFDLVFEPDAIMFAYGSKRSYVPLRNIQLVDAESSILLRMFRLRRCNLHTGGGTVIVSPVPVRVAEAIVQAIERQIAIIPNAQRDAS